jgi:hypothetical protein
MLLHVAHRSVPLLGKPRLQAILVIAKIDVGDAELLKSEAYTDLFDFGSEAGELSGG